MTFTQAKKNIVLRFVNWCLMGFGYVLVFKVAEAFGLEDDNNIDVIQGLFVSKYTNFKKHD